MYPPRNIPYFDEDGGCFPSIQEERPFQRGELSTNQSLNSFNKTNRVLLDSKTNLKSNKTTAAVLMDLSKAFDSLPFNLLIAKLAVYGVRTASLKLLRNYLKIENKR